MDTADIQFPPVQNRREWRSPTQVGEYATSIDITNEVGPPAVGHGRASHQACQQHRGATQRSEYPLHVPLLLLVGVVSGAKRVGTTTPERSAGGPSAIRSPRRECR